VYALPVEPKDVLPSRSELEDVSRQEVPSFQARTALDSEASKPAELKSSAPHTCSSVVPTSRGPGESSRRENQPCLPAMSQNSDTARSTRSPDCDRSVTTINTNSSSLSGTPQLPSMSSSAFLSPASPSGACFSKKSVSSRSECEDPSLSPPLRSDSMQNIRSSVDSKAPCDGGVIPLVIDSPLEASPSAPPALSTGNEISGTTLPSCTSRYAPPNIPSRNSHGITANHSASSHLLSDRTLVSHRNETEYCPTNELPPGLEVLPRPVTLPFRSTLASQRLFDHSQSSSSPPTYAGSSSENSMQCDNVPTSFSSTQSNHAGGINSLTAFGEYCSIAFWECYASCMCLALSVSFVTMT